MNETSCVNTNDYEINSFVFAIAYRAPEGSLYKKEIIGQRIAENNGIGKKNYSRYEEVGL